METKINLEEMFNNNFDCYTEVTKHSLSEQEFEPAISKEKFKELCFEFGKQLLELATKNAKIVEDIEYPFMPTINGEFKETVVKVISKQSILKTIDQVE